FKTEYLDKYNVDYIFDATDNLGSRRLIKSLKDEGNCPSQYCKCGYDGYFATLSLNEFDSGRWGEDGSYQIVTSFFGTPQILSAIAVIEMLLSEKEKSMTFNFKCNGLLNKIGEAYGIETE